MSDRFIEVPLNQIRAQNNYRKTFGDEGISGLAQSIKENGVIEPIILRPNGKGYLIVAGERRFRAAEKAKLVTIPAIVRNLDDSEALRVQLVENVQREGVQFMEEAYGVAKFRDDLGLDVSEIATTLGKSEAWVYQVLQLTRMSSEAQRMASNGFLTKQVAMLISRLKDQDTQTQAANDLARTQKGKLITIGIARKYLEKNIEKSGRETVRRNPVQKFNGNDYCANWKKYLVRLNGQQFEYFKQIVRGRTDIPTLSEAIEQVMMEAPVPAPLEKE